MKKIKVIIITCFMNVCAFAGDTNFVADFKTVWQTHNASNILMFTEQNVATNATPETLFARGVIAIMLQSWQGATNHFEQSIQMISTNNVYSANGKTNIINEIRWIQSTVEDITDNALPAWDTTRHAAFFTELSSEPIFFDTLQNISTLETVEP